jgi:uncharacterized phage infection (PIP) family protein YhgE
MNKAIVAVLIAAGLYFYGHHVGWAERDADMQAEIAVKNEEARKAENALKDQLTSQSSKLQEANNAITQKQSALDRAIRSGKLRLPSAGCVQTSSSAPAANGNRDETGSESDRQTLAAIAAIVAQGDRNTEQLNACISAYNEVMEKINGQR